MFETIESVIQSLKVKDVTEERKEILQPLINFIQDNVHKKEPVLLNFICTHNSRRSHLSQVWAQVIANHYKIPSVFCYSGGTEATAVFPKTIETLQKQGFEIHKLSDGDNPVYSIKYSENTHPIVGFSKAYFNDFNPKSGFAAIMTCSQADEGCPFVAGAAKRVPITYEDPKAFDNTPQQEKKYLERSTEIATEMAFVFSQITI